MPNITMSPKKRFRLTDFSGGIVTNVAAESTSGVSIADDILNFVPGIRGELKKAPIGLYTGALPSKIDKILYYAAKTGDRIFITNESGGLYEHKPFNTDYIAKTFPDQRQMFGYYKYDATFVPGGWKEQPTRITDGFTYGGYLFLLTGTKCNYFIDGDDVKIWGQRPIMPPATAEAVGDTWSASTTYAVNDAIVLTNSNNKSYLFKVTQAGTSGSSEPSWDYTTGNSTVDGTVVWYCDKELKVKDEYKNAKYIYTYWDGYCESNPSSFMGSAVDTDTGVVKVKIYTGYGKTQQIRVYRYDNDNGNYKFIKAIDEGVSTPNSYVYFFDLPYEYGYGEIAEFDNTPPPPCRIGTVYKNFVFMAGDVANPERIYFSKLGNPFSFPDYHYITVGQDDGDRITALVALSDMLLIFKERHLYLLAGYDTQTFEVKYIAPVGAVAERSAVAVDDTVYFVGYDGIYATNGMAVQKISFQIDDYFKWKPLPMLKKSTVVYIPEMKAIAFNVNKGIDGSGVYLADTFFYHIEHKAWTRADYGLTDGLTIRDKTYFVLGNKIYVYEDQTFASFTGSIITKWLPLAEPDDRAIIRAISIVAGGVEVGSSATVYYQTDYEEDWHTLKSISFDGSKETVRFSCNIVGNYFRFKIEQSGELEHFVGMILEYRTKGMINKDI